MKFYWSPSKLSPCSLASEHLNVVPPDAVPLSSMLQNSRRSAASGIWKWLCSHNGPSWIISRSLKANGALETIRNAKNIVLKLNWILFFDTINLKMNYCQYYIRAIFREYLINCNLEGQKSSRDFSYKNSTITRDDQCWNEVKVTLNFKIKVITCFFFHLIFL